jgi:hypothetical protein
MNSFLSLSLSVNYENNVRYLIHICNHNRTQIIRENIINLMTLLYENGRCPLIIDKKNVLKQFSIEWDIKYLYLFLNQIYNDETRKIIFHECMKLCPDIINYTSINILDLNKIHYQNFMVYYNTLDDLTKKKFSKYLSYFDF